MSRVPINTSTCQSTGNSTAVLGEQQPRSAATMILVRDQPSGYEVFMIERPANGDFPRLHVFPGGKIDPLDSELEPQCPLLSDRTASQILNLTEQGQCFWVGVIRECFEECNVLFALRNGELLATPTDTDRTQMSESAQRVANSVQSFRSMLEEQELTLATDEVHYFSHWITPEPAPARFNTRFFLGKLPSGQTAHAQTTEVVSSCWVQPSVALNKFRTNEWQMILPTLTTLRMISHYSNTDDLIKQVRAGYHKIPVRLGKQLQGMQPF